jgi:hypothetical protein
MENKRKKTYLDYPHMGFRLSEEDKNEIQERVNRLVDIYNSKQNEEDKLVRKNDVIVDALKRGLSLLEANIKK